MDYKKYCDNAYLREPAVTDIPTVYLPCPHKCYKGKVINRATLTHDQYMALLATPKGFTWDKNTGLSSPKPVLSEDCNEEVTTLVRCTDQRYLRDCVSAIWNVMTPKYRRKLERILMNDFKLSKKQAKDFLKEQKLRSAFSHRNSQSRVNLSERHEWVKDIADTLADKVANYVEEMMRARRTKKVKVMAEAILEGFGELTGEHCDMDQPQNGIQQMQVFASDRLAVWLSRILGDYEEELCRDIIEIPESDTSDEEESPDEKKPKAKPEEKSKNEESVESESKPEETNPAEPRPDETKEAEPLPHEPNPDTPKPEPKPKEPPKPGAPKPEPPKKADVQPLEPNPDSPKPEPKPKEPPKPGAPKPEPPKKADLQPQEPNPDTPKPEPKPKEPPKPGAPKPEPPKH